MITKTITVYTYTVMAVDLAAGEIKRVKLSTNRQIKREKAAESEFYKHFNASDYKFVKIESVERDSRKFVLSTEAFVEAAIEEMNKN